MSTEAEVPASSEPTASVIPPLSFEVKEFSEGAFKGFKYTVPVYNTLDEAIRVFGANVLLNLFNVQAASRIRTKVTNDLPETKNLKDNERATIVANRLASSGGMLFTETQATEWRPDVRDLSPKQLFKKAQALLTEGKTQEGIAMLTKMQEAMLREAQETGAVSVVPTA